MSKINEEGFLELSGLNRTGAKDELNASVFSILDGMTPLSLRVLNQSSRVMKVAKGVEMMHAGDTPHDLYFIAKGSITIVKEVKGELKPVAKLAAGNFYGEYGVLRGKTRYASVYTAEPSVIIRVDLQAVQQVTGADPAFSERLQKVMKERLLSSFLFSYPVFQSMSMPTRDLLAKRLPVSEANRDEVLFKAGDTVNYLYIILSGEVEVFVGSGDRQTVLEIRRDNDLLGETRSDQGTKYAYSVRAASQLDLLVLDKHAMQMIKQVDPDLVSKLNQIVAVQVKKTIAAMQRLPKT